jgi:CheY-like chemotaxis protein
MPKLSGLECLKALRENKTLKFTQFALYTSALTRHQLSEFEKSGAIIFQKPSTYKDLYSIMKVLLQYKQLVYP